MTTFLVTEVMVLVVPLVLFFVGMQKQLFVLSFLGSAGVVLSGLLLFEGAVLLLCVALGILGMAGSGLAIFRGGA